MTITFPHMGNMYIPVKALLDGLKVDYIIPDFNTQAALELGSSIAPETVCLPLKIHLGNFIQAYRKGADTILVAGGNGPCRFGYYCEMYREIMNDNGYKFDIISLEKPQGNWKYFMTSIGKLGRQTNVIAAFVALKRTVWAAGMADKIENLAYIIRPRETIKGQTTKLYKSYLGKMAKTEGWEELKATLSKTLQDLSAISTDVNSRPLKIGIVGEIFTTIDSNSSFNIDVKLGEMGAEVRREVTVSNWIIEHILKGAFHLRKDLDFAEAAKPYLNAMIGGHARETIGHSVLYALSGYDGIIQIYPLTCMPEIVAQSIIPSISRDFDIPVLTLIIDELTGEAGYMTRLEAFVDLLYKRRKNKLGKKQ